MPFFDIAGSILIGLSCFLFTGFIAILVLPDMAMSALLPIPRTIRYVSQKQVHGRALWFLIRNLVFWIGTVCALYALAFLIDPGIGWSVLTGPIAIICWILGLFSLIRTMLFKKEYYLDAYFTGVYMAYATDEELKKYQGFIEHVEQLSIAEAKDELAGKSLSFLEQKALRERILMLQIPDRVDY